MARFYFLAYYILTSCLVAGQSPKYAFKGMGHHLKPSIPKQPNSILWKHNGNIVVEFDGREQHVYSPYEDRLILDWLTAELEITGLTFEDSGDYELEADINNNLYSSAFKLVVIDKVGVPTISCTMDEGSSSELSGAQATLLCSAERGPPQSLTEFEWRSQGKSHPGQKLSIFLGDKLDDEVHSCSVSNPLSSETVSFTARDCYPDKSSSTALIVCLSIIIFILVILLVAAIVYCKQKQRACFAEGDVENQSPAKGMLHDESQMSGSALGDEDRPLIDRAPTFPSKQRLHANQDNTSHNPPSNNPKEDNDSDSNRGNDPPDVKEPAEKDVPPSDHSDSEEGFTLAPTSDSVGLTEVPQSDQGSATEQPGFDKTAQDDKQKPTAESSPPSSTPQTDGTEQDNNESQNDADRNHTENKESKNREEKPDDDVNGSASEETENTADGNEEQSVQMIQEEDKNASSAPARTETSPAAQDTTNTNGKNKHETNEPVLSDSVGEGEKTEEKQCLTSSQQPCSPKTTNADTSDPGTLENSPEAAHTDSDQEKGSK